MELQDNSSKQRDDIHGEPPPDALLAFVDTVARARYVAPRSPAWWLASAMGQKDGRCGYCDAKVQTKGVLDPIIPVIAGGPHHARAVVMCCTVCKRTRRQRDLLSWKPDASPGLKALRLRMALESWNHVTRDMTDMRTKSKADAVITRRWALPRFHCLAAVIPQGGFIGWRPAAQVPTTVQLRLLFKHQGWRLRSSAKSSGCQRADIVTLWFPSQDVVLAAIWDVIEHNGLVRSLELGAPSPSPRTRCDPSHDWTLVLPTIADLVRRRWRNPL